MSFPRGPLVNLTMYGYILRDTPPHLGFFLCVSMMMIIITMAMAMAMAMVIGGGMAAVGHGQVRGNKSVTGVPSRKHGVVLKSVHTGFRGRGGGVLSSVVEKRKRFGGTKIRIVMPNHIYHIRSTSPPHHPIPSYPIPCIACIHIYIYI